jgi:DNA polymerase V
MNDFPSSHGGRRRGAGRKPKSGIPGDSTVTMRVPVGDKAAVIDFLQARWRLRDGTSLPNGGMSPATDPAKFYLPMFSNRIPAGFPSPADDHVEDRIDLNEMLVRNPPATFFVRVKGNSMMGAGIFDGDTLVVDRSIEAQSGSVVVAVVDGELTVKRLSIKRGKVRLLPENPEFSPIEFRDGQELVVWGVVTNVIHPVK